ncbi:SufE family protein [soil metagenome]
MEVPALSPHAVVTDDRAAYLATMTDAPSSLINQASSLDQAFAALVDDFDLLEDWEQRIEYVIDLGKGLAPLPDADRIEANKVPGCAAQVWLATGRNDGRLIFRADSDSAISKGNVALLLTLFSDRTPEDILAFDARAALDRLGLPQALTRQRANGLNAMVGRIRQEALAGA